MQFLSPEGGNAEWRWLGSSASGGLRPSGKAVSRISYHIGNDASKWIRNAPAFARLERENLYPGVDLVIYEMEGEIEYDIRIRPGADLESIRLHVPGGTLDAATGRLHVAGLVQQPPTTFQIASDGRKLPVRSRFRTTPQRDVYRLEVEAHDANRDLIVDPVIRGRNVFGTGEGADEVVAVVGDITVGVTRSRLWNRPMGGSDADIFIRSMNSDGAVFYTFWGGSGDDVALAASQSSFGIAVAGYTTSRDFPVVASYGYSAQTEYGGGDTDGLVLTTQPGGSVSYASYVGGTGNERLTAIDASSQVVFAGEVTAAPITAMMSGRIPYRLGGSGDTDVLIGILGSAESLETSITIIGGQADDHATSIAPVTNAGGNKTYVIAGYTKSPDFPMLRPLQGALGGGTDGWFGAFRMESGKPAEMLRSSFWGGSGEDRIQALVTQKLSDSRTVQVIAAGSTNSKDFPTAVAGALNPAARGLDCFVLKLDPDGFRVLKSFLFGGSADDIPYAVVPNLGEDVLVAGSTLSADLQTGPNPVQLGLGGGSDGFIAQIDGAGKLMWANVIGGEGDDRITTLAALPFNYLTAGKALIRAGGISRSPLWLESVFAGQPDEFLKAGDAGWGFTMDLEFAQSWGQGILVGKNLQAQIPIIVSAPESEAALFTVRSSDPKRLLLSADTSVPGSAQVSYVISSDPYGRPTQVFAQALDSSGMVDAVISGPGIPTRIVPVQLARSAIVPTATSPAFLPPNQSLYVGIAYTPLDPLTGKGLPAQTLRPGLRAYPMLASSDSTGLRQRFRPESEAGPQPGYIPVDALREGTYVLTASSPEFESTAESSIEVNVTTNPRPVLPASPNRSYVAYGAEISLTGNFIGRLRVTSTDAASVAVVGDTGQLMESGTVAAPGYVRILSSDCRDVQVTVENLDWDLGTNVYQFSCGPAIAGLYPASATIPVDGFVFGSLSVEPDGDPPPGYVKRSAASFLFDVFEAFRTTGNGIVYVYQSWFDFNRTAFRFRAVRPGQTTVSIPVPAGIRTRSPLTMRIEVKDVSVNWPEGDILVGERLTQTIYASHDFPDPAPTCEVEIGSAAVARFRANYSTTETPTKISIPGCALRNGINFQAVGRAGQSTTITVTANGRRYQSTIRIMPVLLVPAAQELTMNGKGQILLRAVYVDPVTKQFAAAGRQSEPDELLSYPSVKTISSGGSNCVFAETASSAGSFWTLEAACFGSGSMTVRFFTPAGPFVEPPAYGAVRISSGATSSSVPWSSYRFLTGSPLQVEFGNSSGPPGRFRAISSDPGKVRLAMTGNGPDFSEVESAGSRIFIRAYATEGTVRVLVEHEGGKYSEVWVHLRPATIGFQNQTFEFSTANPMTDTVSLSVAPRIVADLGTNDTLRDWGQLRGGTDPFLVKVTSDRPEILEIRPPTPLLSDAASSGTVGARLNGYGSAQLSIVQPEGFIDTPGPAVRVTKPRLSVTTEPIVGRDLAATLGFALLGAKNDAPLTATSLDPERLLLSSTTEEAGKESVAVPPGGGSIVMHGIASSGTARVRINIPGVDELIVHVELLPSVAVLPELPALASPGSNNNFTIRLAPVRGTEVLSGYFTPRFGVRGAFRLTSNDPSIVRVRDDSGTPSRTNPSTVFSLDFLQPGSAELTFESDGRFPVFGTARRSLRVTRWSVEINASPLIGRGLAATASIGSYYPTQRPTVQLTVVPAGVVQLSLQPEGPWSSSLDVPTKLNQIYLLGSGASDQEVSLELSGPDVIPASKRITLRSTEFAINYPDGNARIPLTGGPAALRLLMINPATYGVTEAALAPGQPPVRVQVQSSDPTVASVSESSIEFQPGSGRRDIVVRPLKRGTAIISLEPPAGFVASSSYGRILVVVE